MKLIYELLSKLNSGIVLSHYTSSLDKIPILKHHRFINYDDLFKSLDIFEINQVFTPSSQVQIIYAIAEFLNQYDSSHNYNIKNTYNLIDQYYNHNLHLKYSNNQLSFIKAAISFIEDKGIYFKSRCQRDAIQKLINAKTKKPIYPILPHYDSNHITSLIDAISKNNSNKILNIDHKKYFNTFSDIEKFYHDNKINIIKSPSIIEEIDIISNVIMKNSQKNTAIIVEDEGLSHQIEVALKYRKINVANRVCDSLSNQSNFFLMVARYLVSEQSYPAVFPDMYEEIIAEQKTLFQSQSNVLILLEINNYIYKLLTNQGLRFESKIDSFDIKKTLYLEFLYYILPQLKVDKNKDVKVNIITMKSAASKSFDVCIFIAAQYSNLLNGKSSFNEKLLVDCFTDILSYNSNIILSYSAQDPVYIVELLYIIQDNNEKKNIKKEKIKDTGLLDHVHLSIPLEKLPKKISVTGIEKLVKDPYSYYVSNILRINPLIDQKDKLDQIFGIVLHDILSQICIQASALNYQDYLLEFMDCYNQIISNYDLSPIVRYTWSVKFQKIAHWFYFYEQSIKDSKLKTIAEKEYVMNLKLSNGHQLNISSRIDRVDIMKNGDINIIDYKTGSIISKKEIVIGYKPQLPIEALILSQNIEMDINRIKCFNIFLNGRNSIGTIQEVEVNLQEIYHNLLHLIENFWNSERIFLLSDYVLKGYVTLYYKHFSRMQMI